MAAGLQIGENAGISAGGEFVVAAIRALSNFRPFTRMQSHGPKRVYTPHSLEFWFGKLENDWSERFSSSQLEIGRQIYRDGQVRELELTDRDAIVHRRVEKKDEYAVIEWSSEGFSVRSSTTDTELAHALAVAGLHEIEELVADEISPLPEDFPVHAPSAVPPAVGSRTSVLSPVTTGLTNRSFAAGNGHPPVRPHVVPAARLSATSRPLLLVFKTKTAGLTFQAFWVEADKKTRHPALGPDAHTNGNGLVSSGERAKLIGLAAYARKAHFHYCQENGAYLLESLTEIPNFLKTTLTAWRRMFALELDDKSANLLKGTRAIELEAVAERADFGFGGVEGFVDQLVGGAFRGRSGGVG
jgi:hypothetical protein